MVTLVGKQNGSTLSSYETKTGLLTEVSNGIKNKQEVMDEKMQQNTIKTFAIRVGSVIGLMVAIGMIFSPITSLLARVPLLGNLVNRGIGLIGAILGITWGLLVIACGLVVLQTCFGNCFDPCGCRLIVFFSMKAKDKKEEAEATA